MLLPTPITPAAHTQRGGVGTLGVGVQAAEMARLAARELPPGKSKQEALQLALAANKRLGLDCGELLDELRTCKMETVLLTAGQQHCAHLLHTPPDLILHLYEHSLTLVSLRLTRFSHRPLPDLPVSKWPTPRRAGWGGLGPWQSWPQPVRSGSYAKCPTRSSNSCW